jgi:hypothetical protein
MLRRYRKGHHEPEDFLLPAGDLFLSQDEAIGVLGILNETLPFTCNIQSIGRDGDEIQ